MNYAIAVVVWGATVVYGVVWGMDVGKARFEAQRLRDERIVAIASSTAASAAAEAISKIEVKNVTITQAMQREVITKQVFRDCRSGSDALRLLNSTATSDAPTTDARANSELPKTGTAR